MVFVVGAAAVAGIAWVLDEYTDVGNEVVLPILLIYGVVTLLIALAALVGILSHFGLSQGKSALGLPEGSVQAVIALVLVLIFAITAVFLLTLNIEETDEVSERLATQILTTTGTLAVAVAGFYFGTRAVETGSMAAESAARTGGAVAAATGATVRVIDPPSPATLSKDPGTRLPIVVSTVPPDAPVTWTLTGDESGEVVQLGPTNFEYRRGSAPQDEVVVKFQLARDPSAVAELTVIPPPKPTEPQTAPPAADQGAA